MEHCDAKYNQAHQVLNILYYNLSYNIEELFMDDTRTVISHGYSFTVKGEIVVMVTSIETDTNDILRITNLLNNCPMYTSDKEVDSRSHIND